MEAGIADACAQRDSGSALPGSQSSEPSSSPSVRIYRGIRREGDARAARSLTARLGAERIAPLAMMGGFMAGTRACVVAALVWSVAGAPSLGCHTKKSLMEIWHGEPREKLLAAWGDPDQESQLEDGREVLTWLKVWNDQYSVRTCKRSFTIDENGKVEDWSYYECPTWAVRTP